MLTLQPAVRLVSKIILNSNVIQIRPTNHLRSGTIPLPRCFSSKDDFFSKNIYSGRQQIKTKGDIIRGDQDKCNDLIETTNEVANDNEISEDSIYDREFADMTVEDFEGLYKNDETDTVKSQIEAILKEYEFHKYNSMGRVPSKIDLIDMERVLLDGTSPSSREKVFNFLYKREMIKRNTTARRQREKAEKEAIRLVKYKAMNEKYGLNRTGLLANGDDGELVYGLWHNSLFCRVPENKLKLGTSAARLMQAALFGKKIIFDFDYENHMTSWTARNAVDQVQEAYGLNRFHYREPFDIWFCNFNEKSKSGEYLVKNSMKNLFSGSMITVKSDCFTNHFDRSRLVYLSPNATSKVEEVGNNDDIYIIGVYNDKGSAKPLTYRKACSLGIRSKSLPLDSYIPWQGGTKSLCVNHVAGILLEVISNGGDWRKALLKHIPQRKIKPIDIVMGEEEQRLSKLRQKEVKKKFSLRYDLEL